MASLRQKSVHLADLLVLAVHCLLGYPQERANLGPAESRETCTPHCNFFPPQQVPSRFSDGGQFVEGAAIIFDIDRGVHRVSMC